MSADMVLDLSAGWHCTPKPVLSSDQGRQSMSAMMPVCTTALPTRQGRRAAVPGCFRTLPLGSRGGYICLQITKLLALCKAHDTSCHATIIPFRTDPLSSELGSQPELGCIRTGERDHLGTRSVVVFCRLQGRFCTALGNRQLAAHRHTSVMFQPPTKRNCPPGGSWL